ncbi:hypothetical protein [Leisingera thetidis]|uniref:hypothetical protein n=1 Tax=Leisingera thetidis TaxID=2930199 RepID=UPI0021F7A756|nr:hypothetical protein [Leisingera thetidis]
MHRLILTTRLAPGTRHLEIGSYISRNRPALRQGGATGMMIRSGEAVHFVLEGPQAVLELATAQARSSRLFASVQVAGLVPVSCRAFDRLCLAYARPELLTEEIRHEIATHTGLKFQQAALAA